VSRRVIPWLLPVPLMLGGAGLAHSSSFRLVYPDSHERARALQASGHVGPAWLPTLIGTGIAIVLTALVARGRCAGGSESSGAPVGLSRLAVLPPLDFPSQAELGSLLCAAALLAVVVELTVISVLALQLPLTLLAYLVARALLVAATRVRACLNGAGEASPATVLAALRALLDPARAASSSAAAWRALRSGPSGRASDHARVRTSASVA
jgi:hypothetical protein